MVSQQSALAGLILRNRATPASLCAAWQAAGLCAPNPLQLPFMLIQVRWQGRGRGRGRGLAACGAAWGAGRLASQLAGVSAFSLRFFAGRALGRAAHDTIGAELPWPAEGGRLQRAGCAWCLGGLIMSRPCTYPRPQAAGEAGVEVSISPDSRMAELSFHRWAGRRGGGGKGPWVGEGLTGPLLPLYQVAASVCCLAAAERQTLLQRHSLRQAKAKGPALLAVGPSKSTTTPRCWACWGWAGRPGSCCGALPRPAPAAAMAMALPQRRPAVALKQEEGRWLRQLQQWG